ncbi:MAG: LCP family protein [Ruminococcus sp.]|nr:LCP family protein [Ruminococcus sp.]
MANSDTKSNFVDISSGNQIKKIYKKKGRAKRILCGFLSVVLLIFGSGLLYYYSLLNSLNYKDLGEKSGDNTGATIATIPELESSYADGELLQNSKVLNVMLFGEDNRKGSNYGRSDTMIMLSIDNVHKKLKMTSFQRDTYVYIPGYGYNKINASYTYGGPTLSIQTIEANFGIKIDRYAVVDFNSFKQIIDTLGGVDMELTQDEIDYINYQMYKNGQSDEWSTIKDEPGIVHIDGQEALWYARNRGLSVGEDGNEIGIDGDDWSRTSKQRKLLETIFESMKDADLGQIVSIVSSIGPLVTTNFKKDEITALVANALTYLQYDIEQYYVPETGYWAYNDNTSAGSVIEITDMEGQRLAFAEFVYEDLVSGSTTTTSP